MHARKSRTSERETDRGALSLSSLKFYGLVARKVHEYERAAASGYFPAERERERTCATANCSRERDGESDLTVRTRLWGELEV